MKRSTLRWRRVFDALALAGLVALAGTHPRTSVAADPEPKAGTETSQPAADPKSGKRSSLQPLERTEPAPGSDPSADHGPLEGLHGAATAMAARDFARAVALTEALAEPAPGSETWFTVGALRGRALRQLGRPEQAVEVLEALWDHKLAARHFPIDALGFELAKSRLDWARSGSLSEKDADRQRGLALRDLAKIEKVDQIRNLAEVRVLAARARLEIEGQGAKGKKAAARQALREIDEILRSYPYHPEIAALWLERARAMERAGSVRDAAEEFRTIAIARAGEPEAEAAWAELERLDKEHKSIAAKPFSSLEQFERATAARRNGMWEASREILDALIEGKAMPAAMRDDALHSRAWTAYKQRDFSQCADDLLPLWKASGSLDLRDELVRCLERAARYDEALDIWEGASKTKSKGLKATALWEATELAVRGGLYERAREFLGRYEAMSKGHKVERVWLHAWIAYRLGDYDKAASGFAEAAKYRGERARANYFRGKLLVRRDDEASRKEGAQLLTSLVRNDPWDYYGLMARQRLLDAGLECPPPPKLVPAADEALPPSREETQALFDGLDASFGAAWPPIRRAKQLYAAGYLEESRREVRIAIEAYLTRGKKVGGPRSEDIYSGLGWKGDWKHPRVAPTKAGRQDLRDRRDNEALRVGLRKLARAVEEPYRHIKLTENEEAPYKSRWHPRAYRASVEREARLRGIDPLHLWSLMYTESRFRRFVVSPVGARGALQIMPSTARMLAERLGELGGMNFDTDRLFEIDTNAHLASYYVAELLQKFHGQAPMAYASYNGGPYNVQRWLEAKANAPGVGEPLELDAFVEEIPFRETYRYTKRVMEVSAAYAMLYRGEVPRWTNAIDPKVEDNIDF